MDNFQKQIMAVHHRLDGLYQLVEQLHERVVSDRPEMEYRERSALQTLSLESDRFGLETTVGRSLGTGDSRSPLQHKDILFDETATLEGYPEQEANISPDLQVKRLTAQLTVAYKRIAHLEEQLLANHHGDYAYANVPHGR